MKAQKTTPNEALKLAIFRTPGMTQSAVAEAAGTYPVRMTRIIKGYAIPTKEEKRLIAKALHLPVKALFPEVAA